ncbi:exosortase E/protease, VPEID-CTERM system [uncultured Roseovarius sp.]|uniref:exosortase E/protease, VPEID-CTERM system n=1 Tax=Roseovarius sp. TaxID=1486281 RepID=UPI0025F10A1A|nr:exosortase E/protease, VPEID-CTERM system [uncultured Roseovarius sp.]
MTEATQIRVLPARAVWLGALFVAEMIVIILAFQVLSQIECRQTVIEGACRALRGLALGVMCVGFLLGIYLWARPEARQGFADICCNRPGGPTARLVHGLGFAVILAPLAVVAPADMNAVFHLVFPVLGLGALLAAFGGLFWLAEPRAWRDWLRGRARSLLALFGLAAVLPGLVVLLGPLWYQQVLTDITFIAVVVLLSLFSDRVTADPTVHVIGADDFLVMVADSCSGIEGFVLITVFLALFAALFRDTLRLKRFWLMIWPLALAASWVFNVLRITALILIGAHLSPGLAVNGFHSFAGWLMFSTLAIGVLVVVSRSTFVMRDPAARSRSDAVSLAGDDVVGRIVPFIVFALSGLIVQAFLPAPALGYPLQVAMMLGALWWARATVRRYLAWPGSLSVGVGALVGVIWVMTAPATAAPDPALAALGGGALALWAALRILGTVTLAPMIEELFFRGYIQARLDRGSVASRVVAVLVSAGLFALLHGRWIEAGLAGVGFSLIYMRKGRLADAIAAHVVANAVIAGVALWQGDWSLI